MDGVWVELVAAPGPYDLGLGGAVFLAYAVVPIWFQPCDGVPIIAEQLRLRLAGDVSIDVVASDIGRRSVDLIVGCDGSLLPVGVGRATSFRGYG